MQNCYMFINNFAPLCNFMTKQNCEGRRKKDSRVRAIILTVFSRYLKKVHIISLI